MHYVPKQKKTRFERENTMKITDLEKLFKRDPDLISDANLMRLHRWAEGQIAGIYLASVDRGSDPANNTRLRLETDKYRTYVNEIIKRHKAAQQAG